MIRTNLVSITYTIIKPQYSVFSLTIAAFIDIDFKPTMQSTGVRFYVKWIYDESDFWETWNGS